MNDRGTATEHHVDDELPAYALDALDPPEQSIVARHLRVCPRCQRLAEGARTLVAQLAFGAPPRRPPADLRERVLARAAREPHGAVFGSDGAHAVMRASHPPMPTPIPFTDAGVGEAPLAGASVTWLRSARRRLPTWVMMAASLPLVLLAGVALGWVMASQGPVQRTPLTVVSVRGSGGIEGHLMMLADQSTASLVLTHLPSLAHSQTYVCWLERDGTMENTCAFQIPPRDDDVSVLLHSTLPMGRYAKVAVAAEPSAHPARPSGTFLASAPLP